MISTLEFDLSTALLRSILASFSDLKWSSLSLANLSALNFNDGQGVYQLGYIDSTGVVQLVYIGKTDVQDGLLTRLTRHSRKVCHRLGMDPSDVFFKAIRVYVFTPMDLEQRLIDDAKEKDPKKKAPAWNTSGFGSNDPGRERDTSSVKSTHFDALYPIDTKLLVTLPFALNTPVTVHSVLSVLKDRASYVIRFEPAAPRKRTPHPDLMNVNVTFNVAVLAVLDVLLILKAALTAAVVGQAWQITVFPGYVILYKETKTYTHGTNL